MDKPVQVLDRVIIRFAGDSGDGMQLTGDRFTSETAAFGNDLSTLPDFPAEIRAPAGSIAGVSGFQVHFADHDILTPGDAPNVLVAMNPAALKANLGDLPKGGTLILNSDAFSHRNLEKAGYSANPLDDGTLTGYAVHAVALTTLTTEALKEFDISKKEAERAKNMFALGLMSWLYHRPIDSTIAFLERKFAARPLIAKANVKAFKAGYNFGETTEIFAVSYEVKPAKLQAGLYRNISGNLALSYGLLAAIEVARIALKYRTPVVLLSDGYLANGSEPWCIPDVHHLPNISTTFATEPNHDGEFWPYLRDPETLARAWAVPGTAGLEHRIGGLEKADGSGNISYDPANHDHMVHLRAAKVAGIAGDIPPLEVDDPGHDARLLVLGWGSTYGPIGAAIRQVRASGGRVAQAHLRHLNPFPANTGEVLRRYDRVLIPEMNMGQLRKLIRAEFLVDAVGYNRVSGLPLKAAELAGQIEALLADTTTTAALSQGANLQ